MLLDASDGQLVLIDDQSCLMPAIEHGEPVLDRARRLVALGRLLDVPVWGTEQVPDKLGPLSAHCGRPASGLPAGADESGV